jgi:hypothetical protein
MTFKVKIGVSGLTPLTMYHFKMQPFIRTSLSSWEQIVSLLVNEAKVGSRGVPLVDEAARRRARGGAYGGALAPYGTTSAPYGTTLAPYGTTPSSQGTRDAPYGTTLAPYGTRLAS